jgi:hypothetical protein
MNTGSQVEFRAFAMGEVKEILSLLTIKGDQYSQDSIPALSNFIECAAVLDITPELDLMTVAQKHWHVLAKWASGNRSVTPHDLRERIRDIIVYMLLLEFMIVDRTSITPETHDIGTSTFTIPWDPNRDIRS